VPRPLRPLTGLLVAATTALIVIGTVVTGAGPHAGDTRKVQRIPLDWQEITQLHVYFVYVVVGLTGDLRGRPGHLPQPRARSQHNKEVLGELDAIEAAR
jgi:hypothetical protein